MARTPSPAAVHSAGIERVVITLGHKGTAVAEVIQQFDFGPMRIEYVWCEASSWKRGHASNILAARSMFAGTEPLLVVMSDHLYVRLSTMSEPWPRLATRPWTSADLGAPIRTAGRAAAAADGRCDALGDARRDCSARRLARDDHVGKQGPLRRALQKR